MRYMNFICDYCELITIELLERIKLGKKNSELFGVGVYSDELVFSKLKRRALRPYVERAQIISAIKGVDFVFEVTDENKIEVMKKQFYKLDSNNKKYKIGYAPGTYDLFHQGHLEHLREAYSQCEKLIVGINDDELVHSYKNKYPMMNAEERSRIVANLKFVSATYIANTLERKGANDWIKEKYGSGIDAVFIGSDWENQDLHNAENLNIVFTTRDSELMKVRSSSYYREEIKKW